MIGGRGRAARAALEARAETLRRAVRVRHRAPGHVRFDLPEALRTPEAAALLTGGLEVVDGVYRVTVFRGPGKLSIRWFEDVCPLSDIVGVLSGLVGEAAALDAGATDDEEEREGGESSVGLLARLKQAAPVRALRARYQDLRAKAEILSKIVAVKTGRPVPAGGELQEWAIHFLNDLVAFYLIRQHWERIIGQWLPRPWTFRYQWLTVFYLTFLLVRYRKGAVPKATRK